MTLNATQNRAGLDPAELALTAEERAERQAVERQLDKELDKAKAGLTFTFWLFNYMQWIDELIKAGACRSIEKRKAGLEAAKGRAVCFQGIARDLKGQYDPEHSRYKISQQLTAKCDGVLKEAQDQFNSFGKLNAPTVKGLRELKKILTDTFGLNRKRGAKS